MRKFHELKQFSLHINKYQHLRARISRAKILTTLNFLLLNKHMLEDKNCKTRIEILHNDT